MILEKAEPAADERALDVGAGTGLLALCLAERVDWVWAIDIAPAMVECLNGRAAAAGLDNIQTAVVSATLLPIADGSIDLAASNYCFYHLGTAGKRAALAELHRVLKPGGRVVFADMMFTLAPFTTRDRTVIAGKVRSLSRRGPGGTLAPGEGRPSHPHLYRRAPGADRVVADGSRGGGFHRDRRRAAGTRGRYSGCAQAAMITALRRRPKAADPPILAGRGRSCAAAPLWLRWRSPRPRPRSGSPSARPLRGAAARPRPPLPPKRPSPREGCEWSSTVGRWRISRPPIWTAGGGRRPWWIPCRPRP